nr:hypothetical protein [uncultured Haemophilus sp.]
MKPLIFITDSQLAATARKRAAELEKSASKEEGNKARRKQLYTEAAALWQKATKESQSANLLDYCEKCAAFCLKQAELASQH